MIPVEFVTGDEAKFYEANEEYTSQTVTSLPSYWSISYDPEDGVTTLVMKGKAASCPKKKKGNKKK